jgi:cytochrome d ubiquinol oxidase subunit II
LFILLEYDYGSDCTYRDLTPSHSLTIWDSASSHLTLAIMFWAAMIFVPIILFYTFWCYKQMWGKITVKFIRDNDHAVY